MELDLKIENLHEQLTKLSAIDSNLKNHISRALHQIGGLWKKTAVAYSPISPSTGRLKKLAKSKTGRAVIKGRKGRPDQLVTLTKFYSDRLPMLLSADKNNTNRPQPGGLMKSINFRSDSDKVECFVPSNSLAGSYAFRIHEEKGQTWRHRGPGTQAKGQQADDKFIIRAANDNKPAFTEMVSSEINKLLEGNR